MSSISLMRPGRLPVGGVSTPSAVLASRDWIRPRALRSELGSAPLLSNAAPISLIERSTAATELMCWAGAVVAAHGRTRPISHCEEGAALYRSARKGAPMIFATPMCVMRRPLEPIGRRLAPCLSYVAPGVSSSTIEASGNLVSISAAKQRGT